MRFKRTRAIRAEYCNLGEGHKKGGVQGDTGWLLRNVLVPVPKAADWLRFNGWLEQQRLACGPRRLAGRRENRGKGFARERTSRK